MSNRFPALLQNYFLDRMMKQRNASPATISAYRDTFRLLLRYLHEAKRYSPSEITMELLTADTILEFLNHLETERHNTIKTRNHRLAAIHSFMEYVSFEAPEYLGLVQRVMQIPFKKAETRTVDYLVAAEVEAILAACNVTQWLGRRDRLMVALLYNTGFRVSELLSLKFAAISLRATSTIRVWGKGRKERVLPIWETTKQYLDDWMKEQGGSNEDYLFANCRGERLTRSGVSSRLNNLAMKAGETCPSLRIKRVTPHVLRHTTAMHLLESGVDISTIAIWLGHESIETTHKYMVADLRLKEQALARTQSPEASNFRYQPSAHILDFLETL
jgi:integrase/recombinase XerD